MLQNKTHTVAFSACFTAVQRLDAVKQALIEQGVPGGHQLYLQVSGYEDLYVGRWPDLYCGDEDLLLATAALITW